MTTPATPPNDESSTRTDGDRIPTRLPVSAPDGARSEIRLCEATGKDAPLLLLWPAMGISARYYDPLAETLSAAGVSTAVAELRGIGSSSVRASRGSDFGFRHLLEYDWPAAIQTLRERHPHAPLWLGGHSLGGQLSALYAAQHPEGLSGLVLVACGSIHYRNWHGRRRWKLLALTQVAAALSLTLGYFPGKRIGFGGTEARSVIRDWARVVRSGRYRARGTDFDYEAALTKLKLPVLGISFDHDGLAPHTSMQNLLARMSAAGATHLRLGDRETGLRMNHFNWVKHPVPMVDAIARRLAGGVPGPAGID